MMEKPEEGREAKEGVELTISLLSISFSTITLIRFDYLLFPIDGILAFSAYTIAITVPSMSNDKTRQRIAAYLWIGIMLLMASVLVSIFHIKNPGYPFKL